MSSRSIGVTNVEFRRWMMSCVIRSPSCSQTTTSRESSPWSGHWSSIRSSRSAERTMLAPASSKRSKNSRSFGANSWERLTMAGQGMETTCWNRPAPPGRASCGRLAPRSDGRAQPLELLGSYPIGMLRPGERTAADLFRVGAHALDHRLADRRVLLDELRLEAGVDGQQVVQDEHLAVRA